MNDVFPDNHTSLTYDEVNERWTAARNFIDIQATGNFNAVQTQNYDAAGPPEDFILTNWADFSNFDMQNIEYITTENAFQFLSLIHISEPTRPY